MRQTIAALAVFLSTAGAGFSKDITLQLPVDCELGHSCYIQNYVDRDPGSSAQDFRCGGLSYDGHKGTDIALRSLEALKQQFAVIAAADGKVVATRTGVKDHDGSQISSMDFGGKECGNGVVVAHADGWVTQYCHMKDGSIIVAKGDEVNSGQILGEVGMTGKTEFPHLHLAVRHNNQVVDPFQMSADTCDAPTAAQSLWSRRIDYRPGGLISAGFSTRIPEFAELKSGWPDRPTLSNDATAIVAFAHIFGGRKRDQVRIQIQGPDGTIVDKIHVLTKSQAVLFRASGKRRRADKWAAGHYSGTVLLIRNGMVIDQRNLTQVIK
jgi:murein DD-endopeptidase MepM/ murein hydrolase activator NlpD